MPKCLLGWNVCEYGALKKDNGQLDFNPTQEKESFSQVQVK